jgi:glycerophosphoryl diester phosphodiesterase
MSWWADRGFGLRIGGHRGDPSRTPENTLASLAGAIDAGADYVELDVRLSRDGVLVVIHDDDLARTTERVGVVEDMTAADLQVLDAGSWFDPRFAAERIPLLDQVLVLLETTRSPAGHAPAAVVEAKGPGTGAPLSRALRASPVADRLAICSFDAAELRAARAVDPAIPTMLIVERDRPGDDPVALAATCGATIVNVPASWLSARDVERMHDAGLLVAGGTGDDEHTIRHAVAIGLDAIDSNRPHEAVGWRATASPSS